jgi:eukaryotic-like serine/threonine-protein kinase
MLLLGDVLDGKYVIESALGRGATGVVYRARHQGLNAYRAIKVMHLELTENADFLARFHNEAKLAEELRHPNIVSLYDLCPLPDGTPYIVWEYVEGETLAHALGGGAVFTPVEVVDLVGGVARGLSAAHERKIVHRDISPDNLMLTRDPQGLRRLKVLDFGMAKLVGAWTEPGSGSSGLGVFLGKIGYSSPEQAGLVDDAEALDGRSDVFSLAVVAYRMLTGKLPFRTSSIHSFLYDLTTAPEEQVRARFERELPPGFRTALARALRRDRSERTASMEELKEDLERALSMEGSPSGTLAPRRTSRARLLIPLALGAGVLVALFLPVGKTGPRQGQGPGPGPTLDRPPVAARTTAPLVAQPRRAPTSAEAPPVEDPAPNTTVARPASARSHPPVPSRSGRDVSTRPTTPIPTLDLGVEPEPEPLPLPGQVVNVSVPASTPRAYGSLSVTSEAWVRVRLDDGPPAETPILLRGIPAGAHVLRVTRGSGSGDGGGPERILDVVVREGETTAVHLDLEPHS